MTDSLSRSRPQQIVGFIGWQVLVFLAAAAGALASTDSPQFYAQLQRPSWAPPAWLFGPVWTLLYFLMGVAAWLVWRERGFRGAAVALSLFVVQLLLNAAWTWIFFVRHQGGAAFVEILVLWVLIVAVVVGFWRVRPAAGMLLLPYLAWVSFASVLTYTVWQLNPGLLS